LGVLSFISPLPLVSFAPSISSEMKSFVLEQDNIEFGYPENWIAELTPQGNHGDQEVIAIVLDPREIFLDILVARKQFDNIDISSVAAWGRLRAQARFSRYKLNAQIPYSSEHFSGLIDEYVGGIDSPLETQDAHCKDLYFLHEGRGYAFSFCADESDQIEAFPVFDKVIASIRFLE